jgi:hypothetical protein
MQLATSKMNSYLNDDDNFRDELDDPQVAKPSASVALVVSMAESLNISFSEKVYLAQVILLGCERKMAFFLDEIEAKEDGDMMAQKEAIRSVTACWSTVFDCIETLSMANAAETQGYLGIIP